MKGAGKQLNKWSAQLGLGKDIVCFIMILGNWKARYDKFLENLSYNYSKSQLYDVIHT